MKIAFILIPFFIFNCADVANKQTTKSNDTLTNDHFVANMTCVTTGKGDHGEAILDVGYKVVFNNNSQISFYQTSGWGPDKKILDNANIIDPHISSINQPGFVVYELDTAKLEPDSKISDFKVIFKKGQTKTATLDMKYDGKPILSALKNLSCTANPS